MYFDTITVTVSGVSMKNIIFLALYTMPWSVSSCQNYFIVRQYFEISSEWEVTPFITPVSLSSSCFICLEVVWCGWFNYLTCHYQLELI